MNDEELEARLRGADVDLGQSATMGRAPRVADLERRHRRQVLGRGAVVALLLALAATAHWSRTLHHVDGGAASISLGQAAPRLMDEHLTDLGSAVAELRELRLEARRPIGMDSTSLLGFRALSRGVAADDEAATHEIRWIAERFPNTHGGRCAHAFLEGASAAAATSPLTLEPRNER
mgnify:CR=1 FL=1